MLYLAVCPRVSYGQLGHTDVVVVAERQEFLAGELCPIIGDDGVRNPKPMDDVSEEHHRLLGLDSIDQTSLDPLGEPVNSYQQVGVAPGGLFIEAQPCPAPTRRTAT